MEEKKARYTIAGHEFVLTDQIAQAAEFVLWAKDWIGDAVQASPQASIAWAGVCLILPLLTNPTTTAKDNRDGFTYVTTRMRYYAALEPLLRRLGQNAGVADALMSEANDHIIDLYQHILEFQICSVLRFYRSRLKTYIKDMLPKDWKQMTLDIKTREETVNRDLGQINELVSRQELEILNKTSTDALGAIEEFLSVSTQQLAVLKEQLAIQQAIQQDAVRQKLSDQQKKCLQLFRLTSSDKDVTYEWYKDRVEDRVQDTCLWFLQHDHFQRWLAQESDPLLVSADPGCGKSVLSKYLIDHELSQQSATICYFFFKDQDQNTARQALLASYFGHDSVVKLLLEKGADVEAKAEDGRTPLSYAAAEEHEAVARLLFEKGADIEAKAYHNWTPLFFAADGGHEAVTRLLLEKGADVEAKDDYGRTPLFFAAQGEREAVARLLLEKGADIEAKDNRGRTPLSYTADGGYEAVARLLLEKGAVVEAKADHGRTPLFFAVQGGHEAVARLLLEKGADAEAKDDDSWTSLFLAAAVGGYEAVARLLLEKGSDVEAKDNRGRTPLSYAAVGGYEAVARLLLEKGADVEAKDNRGRTPLSYAADGGHEAIVKLFGSYGARS
ncbi:hypothetical protein Sste5344_004950 [Sporothrix stenoceras]